MLVIEKKTVSDTTLTQSTAWKRCKNRQVYTLKWSFKSVKKY